MTRPCWIDLRIAHLAAATVASILSMSAPLSAAAVKVGVISPVTGPVALDGESFRNGAMLAVKQINNTASGNAPMIDLVIEDGECKPNVSANAAQKLLVRDVVPVIVGAHCSAATAAVIPIAERQKVALVSGVSSAPSLTQTVHPFFFRLAPTEAMTAAVSVPFYLDRVKFDSVAIVALNDEWGRQAAEVNGALLQARGVKVVSTDYFLPGESEFGAMLATVKAANPQALFVAANTREAILIAKKAEELGLKQKRIGVGAWPTNTFITRAGDAGMGWTVISQYVPGLDNATNKLFVEAYTKAYGAPPDKYAVSGYDAMTVVADAIKRADRPDSASIRAALEKTSLDVVQGHVAFDVNHQAYTDAVISENRDGQSKVVTVTPTKPQ